MIMPLNDKMIIDLIVLVLLFGPPVVAFLSYDKTERHQPLIMTILYVISWAAIGYLQIIALMFIVVPVAWYFALIPTIKKWKQSGKKVF